MKKKLSLLLCLCLIICSFSFGVNADDSQSEITDDTILAYKDNEIIVTTNVYYNADDFSGAGPYSFNGISITEIKPLFDATTSESVAAWISEVGQNFIYCITLDESWELDNAISILSSSQNVIMTSYNYLLTNSDAVAVDPDVSLEDTVISSTGTDFDQPLLDYLNIESAWSQSFKGSSDVKVAIIDAGFVQHSDLENNVIWELAYNQADNNSNVSPDDDADETEEHHGNMIAGIIGADYNDGGIDGLCQSVSIIPIKVNLTSSQYVDSLYQCADYAIQNGADIINISISMNYSMSQLVYLTEQAEVLVVTSAGNSNVDIGRTNDYARGKQHDSPYWIVVGASNLDDTKGFASCYSSTYVDIFAPSELIYSTAATGYYQFESAATSYASPIVAATCALIMSTATHLTPLQVRQLILDNAKPVEGFDDLCVSGGVLSITRAIDSLYDEYRGIYTKGDITGDGHVTTADYLACKQVVMGTIDNPSELQIAAADVNGNGTNEMADYLLIKKYVYREFYFAPY